MAVAAVAVSPDGQELPGLIVRAVKGRRSLLGIAGAPGSGKSMLAAAVLDALGDRAALVPMDGFHLADVQLARRSLLDRKGAPETFDAWGYAALLKRAQEIPEHAVYAPGFERDLEQPLAASQVVEPGAELLIADGNYRLLPSPEWEAVRAHLDQVWFVRTEDELRRRRLLARHITFGKSPSEAAAWVDRVDEPNARLVAGTAARADLILDLTVWRGTLPTVPS